MALKYPKVRGKGEVFKFPQQEKQCPEGSTRFHLMEGGRRCIQGRGEATGECADSSTAVLQEGAMKCSLRGTGGRASHVRDYIRTCQFQLSEIQLKRN